MRRRWTEGFKGSISPSFYVQLFHTKVFWAAFMYLHFRFVLFWHKENGPKAACKMLVKLTTGLNFNNIFWATFLYKSVMRSFSVVAVYVSIFLRKEIGNWAAQKHFVKLITAHLQRRKLLRSNEERTKNRADDDWHFCAGKTWWRSSSALPYLVFWESRHLPWFVPVQGTLWHQHLLSVPDNEAKRYNKI